MFEPEIEDAATYSALGEFMFKFTTLETYIRFALIAATNADENAGMFLVRKMDAKICLTKLRAVLKQRHKLPVGVSWLITECQRASDFRNKIIHTAPIIKGAPTSLYVLPFGSNIQTGQSGTSLECIPNEQLILAANFCTEAFIDLSCLRRTAKRREKLAIAGRTKAAFPEGFPNYSTASQARTHRPDQKAYEAAQELSDRLAGDL